MANFEQLVQALINQNEEMGHSMDTITNWLYRVVYYHCTGLAHTEEPMIELDTYNEYITACHEERMRYYLCYNAGRPCVSINIEYVDDCDKQKSKTIAIIDLNTKLQVA